MSERVAPSDTELETLYGWIPWRAPLLVTRADGASGLACRYCIAAFGLRAEDVGQLFGSESEHQEHLDTFHPRR